MLADFPCQIHLHGHDFAILQQSTQKYSPDRLNLTLSNPPRRDVVLLPVDGFVVIAFKSDNPGTWLMHCHIGKILWNNIQIVEKCTHTRIHSLPC